MDSVGEAVTFRIRETITNKLIELGVPFEKELPDYIMVMVANKKSRFQMEEDLFLFLGDGTTEFMDWFEKTMKKFQTSSVKQLDEISSPYPGENVGFIPSTSLKRKFEDSSVPKAFASYSESDVLTLEIPEQDADFLGEDLKDISKSTLISHSGSLNDKILLGKKSIEPLQTSIVNKVQVLPMSKKKCIAVGENSFACQQKNKIVPCSAVIPVKRSEATEVDGEMSEQPFGSVASIIRVTERKSSVPLALQANKLLLLKAVAAANKSVMEHQKPTKCLKLIQESSSILKSDSSTEKDTRIAVLGEEPSSSILTITRKPKSVNDSLYVLPEDESQKLNVIYPSLLPELTIPSETEIVYDTTEHSFATDMRQRMEISNSTADHSKKIDKACATEDEVQCTSTVSPRFIVTLDGIDPTTLKQKRKRDDLMEVDSDETSFPRVFLDADTKNFIPVESQCSSSLETKLKINEKCRYWPACKSGDLCSYHHPTTTCKAFPKCVYGDKCLFIHPNCKFDALCSRKDCPYTHASKRKIPADEVPQLKKPHSSSLVPCKYFPNCTSKRCAFFHPRTCWYGSQCNYPDCPYSHPLPVRDQLKWCAQ